MDGSSPPTTPPPGKPRPTAAAPDAERLNHLPPLGGLCSRAEAARVGYAVEDSVRRLLRYHWIEKRLMEIQVSRIPSTPEWEVKGALALHQWLDVEHADALRARIREMRRPPPRMDAPPDERLEAFLAEVAAAEDTVELLAGVHRVARRELLDAYRRHLEETNPLVDHPTRRILRAAVAEEEEMLEWGQRAVEVLVEAAPDPEGVGERVAAWEGHLRAYLEAAGGVAGDGAGPAETGGAGARSRAREGGAGPGEPADLPLPRAPEAEPPSMQPRRDARFRGAHNFNFPPHVLYNREHVPAEERNLALLCKRLLEMDVPEMMASFMTERRDRPWGFYRDYSRQLWDEARHSMMGEVALEARGVEWRAIPLNVGFSLRLNLHAEPLERQLMLWAIEQSLMPGDTGKRFEYETAREAGDALSAHFHDYDWADEVLHAQIGRRWLTEEGVSVQEAMERGKAVNEGTWDILERYRREADQTEWWSDFVRDVLGRETSARPEELVEDPEVIAE